MGLGLSRYRNPQILTDLLRQEIVYLVMARDRRNAMRRGIKKDAMSRAFADKYAALFTKIFKEIPALHIRP